MAPRYVIILNGLPGSNRGNVAKEIEKQLSPRSIIRIFHDNINDLAFHVDKWAGIVGVQDEYAQRSLEADLRHHICNGFRKLLLESEDVIIISCTLISDDPMDVEAMDEYIHVALGAGIDVAYGIFVFEGSLDNLCNTKSVEREYLFKFGKLAEDLTEKEKALLAGGEDGLVPNDKLLTRRFKAPCNENCAGVAEVILEIMESELDTTVTGEAQPNGADTSTTDAGLDSQQLTPAADAAQKMSGLAVADSV